MNILQKAVFRANNFLNGTAIEQAVRNKFNEAFLWGVGNFSAYDPNGKTYLEKGYNVNPLVYSVINQQATKTASIPFSVKEIEDKESLRKLNTLEIATKHNLTPQQLIKKVLLENKAFKEGSLPFPMDKPNATQTWAELFALWKTFMKLTGNAYFYLLAPTEGMNKGKPIQVYLLPSHLTQIALKQGVGLLDGENPIGSYIMIEGNKYIEFEAVNVIHTKYLILITGKTVSIYTDNHH